MPKYLESLHKYLSTVTQLLKCKEKGEVIFDKYSIFIKIEVITCLKSNNFG